MLRRSLAVATVMYLLAAVSSPTAQTPPAKSGAAAKPAMSDADMIKLATSAAPADIGGKATVIDHGPDGKPRTVRQGSNGWTCMSHPEVMCIDRGWQDWVDAWVNKRAPKTSGVGIAYMLQGDKTGASNTDPFATAPSATNQWIVAPAHIMVLTSDLKQLDALPTDPYGGGPWVMWKGTPYAHIMVPIAPMPPRPAK